MVRRLAAASGGSSLVLLVAACGLDDLTGGAVDAGAADASSTPGADAARDGASATPEAGADGGSAGCAAFPPTVKFCDDFDTGDSTLEKWPLATVDPGSVVEKSAAQSKSAPRAARFRAGAPASVKPSDGIGASLRKTFPDSPPKIRWSFSMIVPEAPKTTGSFVAFAPIAFNVPTGYLDVRLESERNAAGALTTRIQQTIEVAQPYDYIEATLSDPLPVGRWFRVEVNIDVQSHTVSVSFDGKVEATMTLDAKYKPSPFIARAGIHYVSAKNDAPSPVDGWEMFFDDVVVDYD